MSPQQHTDRYVHSIQKFDVQNSTEEELKEQIDAALESGVRWAIVIPAEGIIHLTTDDDTQCQYLCSEGRQGWQATITSTLQSLGFFTEYTPPVVVPRELTIAREGENPQYMVGIPLNEMKTEHHLMKA